MGLDCEMAHTTANFLHEMGLILPPPRLALIPQTARCRHVPNVVTRAFRKS
jgi:hypothetical protein